MPVRIIRYLVAFVIAAVVTYVLAATFYAQAILTGLGGVGVDVSMSDRVNASIENIRGMTDSLFGGMLFGYISTYAEAIAIGLLVAFPVAMLVKTVLRPLAPIAYPVAGAVALLVIILFVHNTLSPGLLAGARGVPGIALQMAAGLIGGAVFAMIRPHPQRA